MCNSADWKEFLQIFIRIIDFIFTVATQEKGLGIIDSWLEIPVHCMLVLKWTKYRTYRRPPYNTLMIHYLIISVSLCTTKYRKIKISYSNVNKKNHWGLIKAPKTFDSSTLKWEDTKVKRKMCNIICVVKKTQQIQITTIFIIERVIRLDIR